MNEYKKTTKRPASSSSFIFNSFCVVLFFIIITALKLLNPQWLSLWITTSALIVVTIVLWSYDLIIRRVQARSSVGLQAPSKPSRIRLLTKLWALYVTLGVLFAVYHYGFTHFNFLFMVYTLDWFCVILPVFLPLSIYYFWEVDRRQKDPHDEYWHMGCLLTGRVTQVNFKIIKHYILSWGIKGFFIPFIFAILINYVDTIVTYSWQQVNFLLVFNRILDCLYVIDALFGVLGYILTTRLVDTHIRSTEPTVLGWLVCLMCYGPFHVYFGIGLFEYNDGQYWSHWLQNIPVLYYSIAGLIVLLSMIYCLASVAIGYRMSNLTYRGIITDGPYRFSKHPAYVGKVASWWLISLPFLTTGDAALAVKHTAALLFITLIYYLRAKTEENHLANYPEYIEYAEWINQHGIFNSFFRYFPHLKFSVEKSKKWHSVVDRSS